MSIKIQKTPPYFQPVTISITATTPEELDMLTHLLGSNNTISKNLYAGVPEKQKKCDRMLSNIYVCLTNA